ncbi:hypothetical protein ACTNBM_03065 [Lachnospiraceae bacterium HCP1S3_C3]|nr:hypothetical protein [Lachnospiraceae bacterium]
MKKFLKCLGIFFVLFVLGIWYLANHPTFSLRINLADFFIDSALYLILFSLYLARLAKRRKEGK